jgi:hypothetical protein
MVILNLNLIGPGQITIPAVIRTVDLTSDTLDWFTDWFPRMYDLSGNKIYEDSIWDVPKIWGACEAQGTKVMLLEADERIQGYTTTNFNHVGKDKNKCTYIPFLASAPWNRKYSVEEREILNVGKILVATSCLLGFAKNHSPVIELNSLPGAERFYHRIGMRETGQVNNGLKEFRLESVKGFELIRFLQPFINEGSQ